MAKLSEELKEAISRMPMKDKDRLLFRLVAKDTVLTKKLAFELLEGDSKDVERRTKDLVKTIELSFPPTNVSYYTPGYLLMDMRAINPKITLHVKVTKDKFSEVYLTILLVRRAYELHHKMLKSFPVGRSATFVRYVMQRLKSIFTRIEKLDADYYLELEEPLNELLAYVYDFKPSREAAIEAGYPNVWTY